MPKVLNAKLVGTKVENSVYCGRPSRYGNPFHIGFDGTREEVIKKFEIYLLSNKEFLADVRTNLKGKNLICWCAPKACHCDILLREANVSDFFI